MQSIAPFAASTISKAKTVTSKAETATRRGRSIQTSALSLEVQARLVAPLYANLGTRLVGHLEGLIFCIFAITQIGGIWPRVLLAIHLALLAVRVALIRTIRRSSDPSDPTSVLRWRLPYQAVGYAWCAGCAALCAFCVAGDETTRLVTVFLMLGATALIASRSAGMPRFALTQMVIWMSPFLVLAPTMKYSGWILLMTALYVLALNANVRQHYRDMLALIDAERLSQQTQAALAEREACLQSSQDLLRLSLDIGGVCTFQRDYASGSIQCSREARLMHALPIDDLPISTERWLATVVPQDQARLLKHFATQQSLSTFEYCFLHPTHGLRYAETRSKIEYDSTGRPQSSIGVIIDITERRRVESRMVHLAHHDPLTDLPNRSLFRIHLEEALENARYGSGCAILYLDLDQFKGVNDTLGHSIGDILLRAVTKRLQAACRSTDKIARLGGDEFVIIQAPFKQRTDTAVFADRVIAAISAPYVIEGHDIRIGASIGIAFAPDDGLDPDEILRNADTALYGAKNAGRGGHHMFDRASHDRTPGRQTQGADLMQKMQKA